MESKVILRRRFHLNQWYHRAFAVLTTLVAWNQVSYLSLWNWLAACIFIWFSGYKFLSKSNISVLKILLFMHATFVCLAMSLLLTWIWTSYSLTKEEDIDFKTMLHDKINMNFSNNIFGYRTAFSQLLEQLISYLFVLVLLVIMLPNMVEPENEEVESQHLGSDQERLTFAQIQTPKLLQPSEDELIEAQNDSYDEQFTMKQQRVAYERQSGILEKVMLLIILLIVINDGLSIFFLAICLLTWLMIYFHQVENTERFKVCKVINIAVACVCSVGLYLLIIPSLYSKDHPNVCLIITGALMLNNFLRALILIIIIMVVLLSVRVLHYHSLLNVDSVAQVDTAIEQEKKKTRSEQQSTSSITIRICQNYFGIIIMLSILWIAKEFSILRGSVFLLIVVGLSKRYRFKARKRRQMSIAILYVAQVQFILNLLFNVLLDGSNYQSLFSFFGMHEQANQSSYSYYFWSRCSSVLVDLTYILTLTWLISSQETLDDKRHKRMINELVYQKLSVRKQDSEFSRFQNWMVYTWEEYFRSLLINFDKFVILMCLLISLRQADVFRGLFLVFFMVYVFRDLQQRKYFMRMHVNINFVMLFSLYTLELLYYENIEQLNIYAQTVGMNDFEDAPVKVPFYFVYQFWDIILGNVLLMFQLSVVQKTDTMIQYKRNLQILVEYDENHVIEESVMIIKVFRMMDPMKQFFVRYGILLCMLSIIVVALIPPANLLSLVYIFFFQAFLYMQYGSQDIKYESVIKYYGILIILSIIIIMIRYTYTISFVNVLIESIFVGPTLLSDLGLNPNLNTFQLISNGLVLHLLASYRRLYRSKMFELLNQHYRVIRQDERKRTIDHRSYGYTFYAIKCRLYVFGVYHLQKFIFVFAFYTAIYQQSYIGIMFACMIFLIIFLEKNNNWTQISVPLLVVLFLQILLQYSFQAALFQQLLQGEETLKWIGIFDQQDIKYWIVMAQLHFCQILPLVQTMCRIQIQPILSRYNIRPENREVPQLTQWHQMLLLLHPAYETVRTRRDKKPSEQVLEESQLGSVSLDSDKSSKDNEISDFVLQSEMKSIEDPVERFEHLRQYFQLQSKKVQYLEYLQCLPIYRSLRVHQQCDQFFTQIGLEICLFFMVITAYYQRNFFSVFYIVVASVFANFSTRLQAHQYGTGVKKFRAALNVLCVLMMLEVMRKYFVLQWTPSSWDVRKPWWYWHYTCNLAGKSAFNDDDPENNVSDFMKCQTDWTYWLSLQGYQHFDIWITFFAFMITVTYLRHFSTIERLQQEFQLKEEAKHDLVIQSRETINTDQNQSGSSDEDDDRQDFTYGGNRKRLSDFVKFYVFCYFYKLPLLVFLLIGVSSDISSYTEIISCIYFFTAINMLYQSQQQETRKHQTWNYLILFNTVIMIMMSLYQAPFVPCPVLYEESRYYYDNTECVQMQRTNHYYNSDFFIFLQDSFQSLADNNKDNNHKYENVHASEVIYMFLSHILGLNKTQEYYTLQIFISFRLGFSRETLMALFFFLGLLQRNIWQHEYTKKYVLPFFLRQQDKQRRAAIQLVEGIHLRRIWDFKYTQAQKECHDSMQERVSMRVKKWDEIFQTDDIKQTSFFYSANIQQQLNNRQKDENEERVRMIRFVEETNPGPDTRRIHTSFESDDFEELRREDEKKIILAEQIVQSNKAPVIQLLDACAIVREAQDDPELLEILLEELKLLEERALLESIYLNDKIGLFRYFDHTIASMDVEIDEVTKMKVNYIKSKERKESIIMKNKNATIDSQERKVYQSGDLELPINSKKLRSQSSYSQPNLNVLQIQGLSQSTHQLSQFQLESQQPDKLIQDEEQKSPVTETVSESADSLPDQTVVQNTVSASINNSVDVSNKQRQKHTALTNMWLGFKQLLRQFLISVLMHDTHLRESVVRKQEIDRKKLSVLIFFFFAHYFVNICVLLMVINACYNGNLLAIFLPLSAFLYGLIENPVQNKRYWNFLLIYIMVVISLKFVYQMPIFCDSPPYTFIGLSHEESCEARMPTVNERITRIDYVIGVRKYSDGETFLQNVWLELVLFIFFLVQRFLLQISGLWDHVRLSKDRYYIPQFKEKKIEKSAKLLKKGDEEAPTPKRDEEEDDFSELSQMASEVPQVGLMDRATALQTSTQLAFVDFFYRVFPTFLPIMFVQSVWQRVRRAPSWDQDVNQGEHQILQDADSVQSDSVLQSADAMNQFEFGSGIMGQPDMVMSQEFNNNPAGWELRDKEAIMFPEQIKTGRDMYLPGFIMCLIILVYFLLFFPNIISKKSYAQINQGNSQRFSSEVIFVLLLVIAIIVVDRMLFVIRKVTSNPNDIQFMTSQSPTPKDDFSKFTLITKATMHVTLILLVHYYFFISIPRQTNRRFSENKYLIGGYLLTCAYFLVSSMQIRYGYPGSEINQAFTSSKERVNSTAFTIYRAIPFLYELKIIIDWTFTTTALDLLQWFKLEDIFASLYVCQAYMNNRHKNHKLGHSREPSEKCTSGFCFALLLVFIIILPILIFSSLNPSVEIDNIESGTFTIKASFIGQEDKLFFTLFTVNDIELLEVSDEQFATIQRVYGEVESSWQERMQRVRIKRFSDVEWNLPLNYRDQIRNMIKSQDYQVEVEVEWTFLKSDKKGGTKMHYGSNKINAYDSFVNNFGKILAPKSPDAKFDVDRLLPKFVYVGEPIETDVLRLEPVNIREDASFFQDLRLVHKKTGDETFFELLSNDKSPDFASIGASDPQSKVEFFVLNELGFGSIVGAMSTNVSILGIYATFVLAIGRFIRLNYDKISVRVTYEEMPKVGELFDLCQSIYIARVDGNLKKEEIFYELLIRIYRSPEILFKMTGTSIYDQ